MSDGIAEYFLVPLNERETVMTFDEYSEKVRSIPDNLFLRTDDETLYREYKSYVSDCEKYDCTDIAVRKYATTEEDAEKDFHERILPEYPNAIKGFS